MFNITKRSKEHADLKNQIKGLHKSIISTLQDRNLLLESIKNSNIYFDSSGEIFFTDADLLKDLGYDSLFGKNIKSITNSFKELINNIEGNYDFFKKTGEKINMHCKSFSSKEGIIFCSIL